MLIASEGVTGRTLLTGIYAALAGPCYETPAEIRALKAMGADAVGMSTAIEAEAAAARGLEVFGLSCITNKAAGLSKGVLSHDEVQANGALAAKRVGHLIEFILQTTTHNSQCADSKFIGYIGDGDFHDSIIVAVEQQSDMIRVQIRGYSGKEYAAEFRGVTSVKNNRSEGMVLYAIAEFTSNSSCRRFVFSNWDDQGDAYLEIEAKQMTVL